MIKFNLKYINSESFEDRFVERDSMGTTRLDTGLSVSSFFSSGYLLPRQAPGYEKKV